MKYTSTQITKVYCDSKGVEYKEGDIVYNPCFGDYWVVRYSIPSDNTLCPYQLVLWDSRDEYCMDLDEPTGFEIVRRKGDKEYKSLLKSVHKIRRKHKWEDFKQDNIFKRMFKSISSTVGFIIGLIAIIALIIFIPIIALILSTICVVILFIIFVCMDGED